MLEMPNAKCRVPNEEITLKGQMLLFLIRHSAFGIRHFHNSPFGILIIFYPTDTFSTHPAAPNGRETAGS